MKKNEKPSASDRTVGMFDGKTDQEKLDEAERIRQGLDNVEQSKASSDTLEQSADRWRAEAFKGREHVSRFFGLESPHENQYRLSSRDGSLYLEKLGYTDKTDKAYSYAGVFFPEGDIVALAKLFVAHAREYLKK